MIRLCLPYPPSVNKAYRSVMTGKGVRAIKSRELRAFEKEAKRAMEESGESWDRLPVGPLALSMWLYTPDNRRRDLDNVLKSSIDSIASALSFDDSRIHELHVYKLLDRGNPRCEVELAKLGVGQ